MTPVESTDSGRVAALLAERLFPKHSCICEMYDVYRGCECDAELVTDIVAALADVVAQAKAEERERIAQAIEARKLTCYSDELGRSARAALSIAATIARIAREDGAPHA